MTAKPWRNVERCIPERYGCYRYLLDIRISTGLKPRLTALLKNPSVASSDQSDPTMGKLEAWARRRGFVGVSVVNLFAWRTPDPRKLNGFPFRKIVGPENNHHILAAVGDADLVVVGWGNPNGVDPRYYGKRISEVRELLCPFRLHAVGPLTKESHPRHALHWNGDAKTFLFGFSARSVVPVVSQQ